MTKGIAERNGRKNNSFEISDVKGNAEKLLIDAHEAALLCGVSRSAWYKAVSSGKAPSPVKFGHSARWLLDEVKAWIMARCPPYSKWKIEREGKWDK